MNRYLDRPGRLGFGLHMVNTTGTLPWTLERRFSLLGLARKPSCTARAVTQAGKDLIVAARRFLFWAANMKFNLTVWRAILWVN